MDLSDPTQSLIPSLDGAVLAVLAGTEGALSVTAVTRLARRGSRAGLSLALDRLTFHGLVIADPANRGYMFASIGTMSSQKPSCPQPRTGPAIAVE